MQKPSIPKGTRDFSPAEMAKRNYIFETIKSVFKLYGFQPIETPAMENLSTLLGKYGDEGDKLLFRILNSGDFLSGVDLSKDISSSSISSHICDRGLRYDLTVPFARYVVQHLNEISFPFKRYQIQLVWRADRPQKGRYREFYQCDADVIGSNALTNETELIGMIDMVFGKLQLNVLIKLNNRKILAGIAQVIDAPEMITDITTAIDKIEKIGKEQVIQELKERNLSPSAIQKLTPVLDFTGNTSEKIAFLKDYLSQSEIGLKGIEEIEFIIDSCTKSNLKTEIELDLTLARGLNYYTGAIIEVKSKDVAIGSICGGGRYDDLTGIFGLKDVSGVGISFGAERIFDVLEQLNLYPTNALETTKAMFVNFGEKEYNYCTPLLNTLRANNISAEIFPENAKIKKQMTYADNKGIKYVLLAGENEINNNTITIKNMVSGEQVEIKNSEILTAIQ